MVRSAKIMIRLLLTAMLCYSAVIKLGDRDTFRETLGMYAVFGEDINEVMINYIPFLELTIAVALLIPQTAKEACIALISLLVVFIGALASLVYRGVDADCGCLGHFATTPSMAIGRNVVIIALLYFVCKKIKPKEESEASEA